MSRPRTKEANPKQIITILAFPHIKKFMLQTYEHQNGIFKAHEHTTFGKLVMLCLLDKREHKELTQITLDDPFYGDKLIETIKIEITEQQLERSPRQFKFNRINIDLDRLFKEMLILWIKSQGQLGQSVKASCRSFLQNYNLDPDGTEYNLDRAYKNWQRSKKK